VLDLLGFEQHPRYVCVFVCMCVSIREYVCVIVCILVGGDSVKAWAWVGVGVGVCMCVCVVSMFV
jgi:cytosine/uracil/thiamine/allantoin permease